MYDNDIDMMHAPAPKVAYPIALVHLCDEAATATCALEP